MTLSTEERLWDLFATAKPPTQPKGLRGARKSRGKSWRNLVPVDPVEPDNIPDELAAKLVEPVSTDRSEQLFDSVSLAIGLGLTDSEVMWCGLCHEAGQDKWGETLAVAIQSMIEKIRPNHPHPGRSCIEAGCRTTVQVKEQVNSIWEHFQSNYHSRSLATDTRLLQAILRLAVTMGSLDFDLSLREAAERASISSNSTVIKSLDRLATARYLRQVRYHTQTGAVRPALRARRWHLHLPVDKSAPHTHAPPPLSIEGCGTNLSLLNPAGEEWFHRNGLGSCYPTYLSLATGFSDEIEIAAHQHQHQKTVRRHLVRLQEVGLAHRKENGAWTIPESVPDDLSATVGTAGKAATLKARHNQERENYQRVQAQLQDRAQSEWEAIRGWGSWLYGEWPEEMPEALRRTR